MIFIYHDIFEHYAANIKHILFHCLVGIISYRFISFRIVSFCSVFIFSFGVTSFLDAVSNLAFDADFFIRICFIYSWFEDGCKCMSWLYLSLSIPLARSFRWVSVCWTGPFYVWHMMSSSHFSYYLCVVFNTMTSMLQIYRINHWHFRKTTQLTRSLVFHFHIFLDVAAVVVVVFVVKLVMVVVFGEFFFVFLSL